MEHKNPDILKSPKNNNSTGFTFKNERKTIVMKRSQ